MHGAKSISVVLPAYNEAGYIRPAVEDFFVPDVVDEVIVVDNNSRDGTAVEARQTRARVVQESRQGYGYALQRGIQEAKGDIVILAEPDGTFIGRDILKLLAYADDFDMVCGTRTSIYVWSLVLFFIALFTKQNTITMVATLVAYDVIVGRRPVRLRVGFVLPYVPFALMTAAYLWLRYVLFHEVAREGALNARALADFRILLDRHLRHVVGGSLDAPAVVVWLLLALVGVAWLVLRRASGGTSGALGPNLLYFGPVWWAIGVLPIAVAGYHSPRHVYLAAVGWAVVLGVVYDAARRYRPSTTWQRGIGIAAAAVAVFYLVPLVVSVREWNRTAAVSHQVVRDVRTAALGAPEGALLVIGAPGRSWEWALPFAVRPPYQRTDLRSRVFIISPRALSCCTAPWFEETRQTIRNWSASGARDYVIAMKWDRETGKLTQVDGRDVPQLAVLMRSLLDMRRPEEADDNLRRMLDVLVGR
jgi:hypothetical protein